MKVSKIQVNNKTITLPFPIYIEEDEISADVLIDKLSKYDWPENRQSDFNYICEEIKKVLNAKLND